jgi:NADPH-dependent 7-cyano-7-deazaguanine reductase QueF
MNPDIVPDNSGTRVVVTRPLRHLCPHSAETDDGQVQIAWTCAGSTIELHSLAAYLNTFADKRISHETLTRAMRNNLSDLPGITDVNVATTWTTAGLAIQVSQVIR